jgi:hypothetical protein
VVAVVAVEEETPSQKEEDVASTALERKERREQCGVPPESWNIWVRAGVHC